MEGGVGGGEGLCGQIRSMQFTVIHLEIVLFSPRLLVSY